VLPLGGSTGFGRQRCETTPYGHPLVVQDDDIQERAVGPRWCVGRDAEWELQHPLFIGWAYQRKFASKSLRLGLRWASGTTLQTLRSTENAQSRYPNR
jgi:hypothetical protein